MFLTRNIPRKVCWPLVLYLAGATLFTVRGAEAIQRNVLFIAIDDQNDWIGCLGGHPQAKTPHIDGLAKRGTLFTNAHCQAPLCNPSRSSLMTGLRPSSTGIYGLAPGIRDVESTKNVVTLPQTFTSAGWTTFTCGKIYHDGSMKLKDRVREFHEWGAAPTPSAAPHRLAQLPGHPLRAMDWGPWPEHDEDVADYQIADAAVAGACASACRQAIFHRVRIPSSPRATLCTAKVVRSFSRKRSVSTDREGRRP